MTYRRASVSSDRRAPTRSESLVDWREPSRNARVLDWRERAHEFGMNPIDGGPLDPPLVEPAARLIAEEEPEALDEQSFSAGEDDRAEAEEPDESGAFAGEDDIDLVRVYLKHIG